MLRTALARASRTLARPATAQVHSGPSLQYMCLIGTDMGCRCRVVRSLPPLYDAARTRTQLAMATTAGSSERMWVTQSHVPTFCLQGYITLNCRPSLCWKAPSPALTSYARVCSRRSLPNGRIGRSPTTLGLPARSSSSTLASPTSPRPPSRFARGSVCPAPALRTRCTAAGAAVSHAGPSRQVWAQDEVNRMKGRE